MLVIEVRLLAGRYHATPWGRNVNEGIPEWPPSPYRFERALYDAWRRKRPDWDGDRVAPILEALASEPPRFFLPRANASHTRVFLSSNTTTPSEKQEIFDSFVIVSPDTPVLMGWQDVSLGEKEIKDLDTLLGLLNYLGRSESWVEVSRVQVPSVTWNCSPASMDKVDSCQGQFERVRVACVVAKEDYTPGTLVPQKRRGRSKEGVAGPTWMDALAWSSSETHKARMSQPPALRFVDYQRPFPAFGVRHAPQRKLLKPVRGVLYALSCKVAPSVTVSLVVAERVRRKLMGIHRGLVGDPSLVSPKFSGKDGEGRPLKGHRHSYYLPLDSDGDGRLDHMLVYCKESLDLTEQVALDRLKSIWQPNGKPDILFTPVAWGEEENLLPLAMRFRSATPFAPSHHYRRGRGDFAVWLSEEVRKELRFRGYPEPVSISRIPLLKTCRRDFLWIDFRRNRKNDDQQLGYGLALEFPEPVRGPFAIGYACHFGLGLFVPAD